MEEMLDRATLGQGDKETIEALLRKGPLLLDVNEIAILRARRMYLTPIESAAFASVLNLEEASAPTDPAADKPKTLSQMNKAELIALSLEKGIVVPEGATNDEIRELLK